MFSVCCQATSFYFYSYFNASILSINISNVASYLLRQSLQNYQIAVSDSTPNIKIMCSNEEFSETVYFIYKKKISNHGSISDGKVSWE